MSDTLKVWQLQVKDLKYPAWTQCLFFCNREDAEKYAAHYLLGPVNWIHGKDNDGPHSYAMAVSVEHPHIAFFLQLVFVHKDLKCLMP